MFDEADISDFYIHNSDGVGVMWSENDVLYTRKFLPKTAKAAWDFYNEHILGKECVVHWRMKTHGLIDLENCHPYPIFGAGTMMPMSLMHNGVLSTGNMADKTKSDTWHYVTDYLRPLLEHHPKMLHNVALKALIEDHIGSGNRFIILNHLGEMVVFNEKDFVEYKGAKLSNTYAWDAWKGGFGSKYSRFQHSWGGFEYTPGVLGNDNDSNSKSTKFFQLLKNKSFHRAYYEITFVQAQAAIEDCGDVMWNTFCEIIGEDCLSNEEIVACVLDVDGVMIPTMYEDEDEDEDVETPTDNDIHKAVMNAARNEEAERVRDEHALIHDDRSTWPYY